MNSHAQFTSSQSTRPAIKVNSRLPVSKSGDANESGSRTPMIAFLGMVSAVAATGNLFLPASDEGSGLASPAALAIVAAGLSAIALWALRHFELNRPEIAVLVLAAAMLPSIITSTQTAESQSKTAQFILTLGIAWSCARILETERNREWFASSIAFFGVFALMMLLLFGSSDPYTGRWSYLGMNPIGVGRILGYGLLAALLLRPGKSPAIRHFVLLTVPMLAFAMTLTQSSGPLVATFAAIVGVLMFTKLNDPATAKATVLIVLGATGSLLFATLIIPQKLAKLLPVIEDDLSGRLELWHRSWNVLREHPFGVGFGNLSRYSPGHAGEGLNYSHNVFLEAAVEGGVPFLVGVVVVTAWSALALLTLPKNRTTATIAMLWIAALVNAQVSSTLIGNRLMWVMLLVPLASNARTLLTKAGQPSDTRSTGRQQR